ncbi:MAG TPA: 30S ribosomal protein S1 [Desulfobacteraceae bacterium]|nr:30S ribosomal protein S1 [Desulfobacteraceae bacterium]
MSEERFEDLFNDRKISAARLKPGDRIDAVVAGISGENIFLDIGGKSEGVLAAAEVRNEQGEIEVGPGDTISVFLLATRRGEMIFTTRLGSGQASLEELEQAFHSGIPVEGRVTEEIKGGFAVIVAGQRGFCPYSQMDIRRIEQPETFLNNTYRFKIIEFSGQGRNMILSARAVLEEERQLQREQLMQTLSEGSRVRGTVTSLREFGAFVDLGGVDGLIPASELSWGRVERVEDVLNTGQEVEVIVSKIDWENDRITLSLKETVESPWSRAVEKFPPGSVHRGRVSRLTPFGAFVTLGSGVDGLLHISKLGAGRRINHPREVLDAGQEITVRVESIEPEKQRIALVPEDEAGGGEEEEAMARKRLSRDRPQSLGTLGDLLSASIKKKK